MITKGFDLFIQPYYATYSGYIFTNKEVRQLEMQRTKNETQSYFLSERVYLIGLQRRIKFDKQRNNS